MNSKQYELLHGVANQGFPPWIEDPDRFQTTKDLVEWGYVKKVEAHTPDTGAGPTRYRFTDKGAALWERASTWKDARHIRLPEAP
jgi:hypothetical protein